MESYDLAQNGFTPVVLLELISAIEVTEKDLVYWEALLLLPNYIYLPLLMQLLSSKLSISDFYMRYNLQSRQFAFTENFNSKKTIFKPVENVKQKMSSGIINGATIFDMYNTEKRKLVLLKQFNESNKEGDIDEIHANNLYLKEQTQNVTTVFDEITLSDFELDEIKRLRLNIKQFIKNKQLRNYAILEKGM